MKIDSALQHVTSLQTQGVKSKTAARAAGTRAAGLVSDNVQITGTSARLQELEARLADVPIEDSAKVESIRQAIAEGSFEVDEEAVAEGMVQETIEQLSHRHAR